MDQAASSGDGKKQSYPGYILYVERTGFAEGSDGYEIGKKERAQGKLQSQVMVRNPHDST